MAKKTTKTPAKKTKKKPVTMADLHKQQDRIEDRLKQMEERLHASITQREPLFENIERMVNKTAYGVRDQGKAFDQRLSAIERLLSTPQDVTGSPDGIKVIIPEQGLEPGDYTDASNEVADALTAMNLPTLSERSLTGFSKVVWSGSQLQGDECLPGAENRTHHPQAEFISRASVTAKKLGLVEVEPKPWKPEVGELVVSIYDIHQPHQVYKWGAAAADTDDEVRPATPEEVAKYHADIEAAKPIVPYVTRVMCDGYEWRVICGMDQLKRYRIHRIEGEFEYCVSVQRHEFTVIDP